jgi:cysteine synthase
MFSWLSARLESISSKAHSLLTQQLFYGILIGFSLSVTSTSLALYFQERRRERIQNQFEARPIELRSDEVIDGVTGLIGMMPQSFLFIILQNNHNLVKETPL